MYLEKEGKLVEGIMDMPANFVPEAMAPIIRFMYTGNNAFLCLCFFNILKISSCNTLKTFAIR